MIDLRHRVATNAFDYSVLVPQQRLRYQVHVRSSPAPRRRRSDSESSCRCARSDHPRGIVCHAPDQAFRRIYFAFHYAALTALLAGVYAYARMWFTRDRALIGALIVGSTLHLVLRMGEYWDFCADSRKHLFAPWALLEPVLVAIGLVLLWRGGSSDVRARDGDRRSQQRGVDHAPAGGAGELEARQSRRLSC